VTRLDNRNRAEIPEQFRQNYALPWMFFAELWVDPNPYSLEHWADVIGTATDPTTPTYTDEALTPRGLAVA
jgi:hypothetical protein